MRIILPFDPNRTDNHHLQMVDYPLFDNPGLLFFDDSLWLGHPNLQQKAVNRRFFELTIRGQSFLACIKKGKLERKTCFFCYFELLVHHLWSEALLQFHVILSCLGILCHISVFLGVHPRLVLSMQNMILFRALRILTLLPACQFNLLTRWPLHRDDQDLKCNQPQLFPRSSGYPRNVSRQPFQLGHQ